MWKKILERFSILYRVVVPAGWLFRLFPSTVGMIHNLCLQLASKNKNSIFMTAFFFEGPMG